MAEPPPPTAPDISPRHRSGTDFRPDRVRRRDHAADEDALDEAEEQEDRSGKPSDLADRRQKAEYLRRQADPGHRHHERASPAEAVRIGAEQS